MATRGIIQLKRLSINYCEYGGSSRVVRDYLKSGRIVDWCQEHPQVFVKVNIRNGHHPYVKADYQSGASQQVTAKTCTTQPNVQELLDMFYNRSGRKTSKRLPQSVQTQTPSIQGVWTPMLNLRNVEFGLKIVEQPAAAAAAAAFTSRSNSRADMNHAFDEGEGDDDDDDEDVDDDMDPDKKGNDKRQERKH